MSAVATLNNGFDANFIRNVSLDVEQTEVRGYADASLDIAEIEALRLDVDSVAPAEAADLLEQSVEKFQGSLTSGDHLRLAKVTDHDGPSMRAAVGRVVSTNLGPAVATRDAIAKEKRMHMVLSALDQVVGNIRGRAMMVSNY
ncbi:MAG: hypothetical protein RIT81_08570 [Deltaproteobacteria bacterium]